MLFGAYGVTLVEISGSKNVGYEKKNMFVLCE